MSVGRTLGRPGVAAVTFSRHGGGIAAVSRLVHRVLVDTVEQDVPAWSLAIDDRRFSTTMRRRVAFGLEVGWAQALRRCDWLIYTHLNLTAVQARLPRAVRRPYAVFLHDVEAWTPLDASTTRVLAGAFLRLANSRYTAERVAAANPGVGSIVPCPLALPPADAEASHRPMPPLDMGSRSVVILGRMAAADRYKGHDQLIEVWPSVVGRVPDATLVCVGEGDDVARLRAKAEASGVGASIRFTGFVDDATRASIYARAALLAMPSRREGFGLVYLEAMAAGVPCLGSIHDAAPDVIVDGATGYLVDQADEGALGDRIVDVLTDEGLRRRLGEAGRARYEHHFTYEAFRRRLVAAVAASLPERSGSAARRHPAETV